jgi:CubicO group peptidase (beta-lactamase class C family)
MYWLNRYILILIGFTLFVSTSCNSQGIYAQQIPPRDYWPTEDWQERTIITQDGSVLLEDLSTQVSSELPFVNSLLVVYRGYIIYEDYFNTLQPEDLQLQQSVAKSITSILVGIALDRGDIPSLDATLGEVLPEYFEDNQNTISREISIRDALTMRSGITYDAVNLTGEFESLEAYNVYLDTRLQERLIYSILSVPQAHDPGAAWQYSTADTQLVSEMFQKLVGQSLSEYAVQHLFKPLGISDSIWRHDANGVTVGGALLWLRPSDMAKIGYLILNDGYWDGNQIVSKKWVQASTQPQGDAINTSTFSVEPITNYGYQWWLWPPGSFGMSSGAYQALGYGGQVILILPDIDTVIVATSNSLVTEQVSIEQQRALTTFVDQSVIGKMISQKESLQFTDH